MWKPRMSRSEVMRLAEEQSGVLTTAQSLAGGITARRIDGLVATGRWVRLHRGVYLTQPGRREWATFAVAALLAAGSGAALSHTSAAHLYGLAPPPQLVHVVIPQHRRVCAPTGVVIIRSDAALVSVDDFAWPWRTGLERTVIDIARTVSLDAAVALATRATQRQLTTPERLRAELRSRKGHRWTRELDAALQVVADGAESTLEVRFVRQVVRPHGLPAPRLQVMAHAGRGWRADAAYEQWGVLVELDGRLGHEGAGRLADARRDRSAAGRGWVTVRAGWLDVATQPCELAADLAKVLSARGWTGATRPCRRTECVVRRTSTR